MTRKNQKKELQSEEEELLAQIREMEMDILPEMNKYVSLKDHVRAAREQQQAYKDGLRLVDNDIEKTNNQITERKINIQTAGERYLQNIRNIDAEIHDIKTDTYKNKDKHQNEMEELRSEIDAVKKLKAELKEELANLNGEHEKIKANQSDKIRKIQNKTRMFLGLLKH